MNILGPGIIKYQYSVAISSAHLQTNLVYAPSTQTKIKFDQTGFCQFMALFHARQLIY